MTNRNPVKQLFITFPHSTCDKIEFRDKLLRFEPDYYKLCEEKHQDGTPHLHAVIRFKNKYSQSHVLKYFKQIFPDDYKRIDVKPVRSIKKAIDYLSKEDPFPLESGPFESLRNPQRNWAINFARKLGYNDLNHLVEACDHRLNVLNKLKANLLAKDLDYLNYTDIEHPFQILQIKSKLFENNQISKDDMTFLLDYYEITLE